MPNHPDKTLVSRSEPFLVLPENRFAYSATELLLRRRRKNEGLLLHIYGASGCGKSHLAENFLRKQRAKKNSLNCRQLTATDLLTRSSNDSCHKMFDDLRTQLRDCNVLICEDIQTLCRQMVSQCFLIGVIDELYVCGCRMIFTSCNSPTQLTGLHPRLVNRLRAGICTSVRMPSLSSRIKLLEHFVISKQIALSKEAIRLIANEMPVSPRELLATLQQIESTARLLKQSLDISLVRRLLNNTVKPQSHSVSKITSTVARDFGVATADLRSHSRFHELVLPRHCAMFLSRLLTDEPYTRIAQQFGNRNHSSVVHACHRIETLLPNQPQLRLRISRIAQQLGANIPGCC